MSGAMTVRRSLPDAEILAFDRGHDASYSMCGIPMYLGGEVGDWRELVARSVEEFAAHDVRVRLRSEVVDIDAAARRVRVRDLQRGAEYEEPYDALLYAAGASPVVPDLPGVRRWGTPVRTLEHARQLHAVLEREQPGSAVVVGGGYIGVEVAEALVRRGVRATLIDRNPQVMDSLDEDVAAELAGILRDFGVDLRLGESLVGVEGDEDGRCRQVRTDRGRYEAQLLVLALGARPASRLAEAAGCRLGARGAIVVDERMRTGVDGIWAAGDCVESLHLVSAQPVNVQLGTHANKQGKVAGLDISAALSGSAARGAAAFPGVVGTAVTKVCEWEVGRTGLSLREAREAGLDAEAVLVEGTAKAGYLPEAGRLLVKLVGERGTGRVLGAQMLGSAGAAKRIDVAAVWCQLGVRVDDAQLHDLAYAPPFGSVWDLVQVAARKLSAELGLPSAL
jgi:NADPH-dependent 2,4-dienoyl-CoA reductase/sulfur reductase-like enzyme